MSDQEINEFFSKLRKKTSETLQKIYEGYEKDIQKILDEGENMAGDIIEITSSYSCFEQPITRQVLIIDNFKTKNGNTMLRYIVLDPSVTWLESIKNIIKMEKLGHIDQIDEIKRLILNL